MRYQISMYFAIIIPRKHKSLQTNMLLQIYFLPIAHCS
jgi:hypothetical protein